MNQLHHGSKKCVEWAKRNVKQPNGYVLFLIFHFLILILFQAKLLEEMDEEFGVRDLVHEEAEKRKQKVFTNLSLSESLFSSFQRYTPKDLTGLRIEHSIEEFKEGQPVILTLKDQSTSFTFLGDMEC